MFAVVKNYQTGHVFIVDDEEGSMLSALRVMRKMRWAHVKRHGRSGQRWFTVVMRNPDEWKCGTACVGGAQVSASLTEV